MRFRDAMSLASAAALVLAGCGGGGNSGSGGGGSPAPTPAPTPSATGAEYAVPAAEALSSADVAQIVARAAAQAQAMGRPATVAVVDRVGNVLAVFRMDGAPALAHIADAPGGANIDIQGLDVPAQAAAIAKAITGAYLSSGGNAFSSRTASQIVQQHFPPAPGAVGLESGPLFGVQFSQLPCSDLAARYMAGGAGALVGPKRSPLGLAADPGGFPLYKNGVLVGGVGVLADGAYSFDPNIVDVDTDVDEAIALAGTTGFEAPTAIRAERINVDGTQLRYTDVAYAGLFNVSSATFADADTRGDLVAVRGYYENPVLLAGTAYGSEASGVRPATVSEFADRDAFVLTNGGGANRFPIRGGTDAGDVTQPITGAEAEAILAEAFAVMTRARAQIRQPLDSRAQVSISLVDTRGAVLGIVRSPDAPVFGIDVSLQKARTASFFSGSFAAGDLAAAGGEVPQFVGRLRTFLNDGTALTGTVAYANRAIGNLARPYFPDGELGRPNGPFSRPIAQFNPFSTGLQSALVLNDLAAHLQFVTGAAATDTPQRCTGLPSVGGQVRLANGMQIFPGSVPVYRGNQLIGAIGVSGDGIDQDDMTGFLGLHNAGVRLGTGIGNAPLAMRSDRVVVDVSGRQVRLRYIGCPFAPFLGTADQNVCQGL